MDSLEKLHHEELHLMKDVIRVLEDNGIRYFLGYGTLLGAVRHHGFIPWDDDVDLFVPRPDFERFKEIADEVIKAPYIVTGNVKDPEVAPHTFILRVEDTTKQFTIEKNGEDCIKNIWLDIFPIDGMPASSLGKKILFLKFRLLFILLRLSRSASRGTSKNARRTIIEKIGIKLNDILKIGKLLNTRKIINRFDRIRMKFPYEESEYVCPLTIDYMDRCICKNSWFGNGKKCRFEDGEFIVPEDSDSVLHQFYGDYMTPPPMEKQKPKHRIKFIINNE